MATAYKVLGQVCPDNAVPTSVYVAPSATQAVISTVTVANLTASAQSFSLSVRPAGAVQENKHYVARLIPVAPNDSTTLTLGITLDATDVITFETSGADASLSCNVFGSEIT